MKFSKTNLSLSQSLVRHLLSTKINVGKKVLKTLTLCLLMLSCNLSCSKEDSPSDNDNNGELIETDGQITTGDFESFEGEIGIVLDARPLAKKGHQPTQVTINIAATEGNYNQTVPIDEFSFMGQLKLPLESLSDTARQELTNGVQVTAEYKDDNGSIIYTEPTFTSSFQSNPSARLANTVNLQETEANQTLALSDNTTYYIQRMAEDGNPDNSAWRYLDSPSYSNVITANVSEFNGNEPDRGFTFIPIPGEMNMYAIRHAESLRYIQVTAISINSGSYHGASTAPNLSNRTSFSQIQGSSDYDNFKFKFEQTDDGSYLIKSVGQNNLPINQIAGFGLSVNEYVTNIADLFNPVYAEEKTWRIVSTNVQWSVTNIGTSFQDPILPKPQTAFSFNSTLTNCGSGTLTQTVGVEDSDTHSNTVGWEETLSMSTSNSVNISATVSVGFEAKFFGTGGDYNLSLTAGYSHNWSSTQENSNWEDKTEQETTVLASTREVTVPSGKASLVYDVYQFYPNTKVNFAQRMRVEGFDSQTNTPLTGEEIRTLFYLNKFNGVITSIEPNSIVITLKGTVILDKVIETESNVQDVPANCN